MNLYRPDKIVVLLLITVVFPPGSIAQLRSIPELFTTIGTKPQIVLCKNELEVNNQGGHLQGVQLFVKDDAEYAFLSGSSGAYAYYSVARLDKYQQVLSVNNLMYKPFKHAGGIQIYQDLMVVGIEDNDAKDKSKVNIYEIEHPEVPPVKPLTTILRNGEPNRSTAGCCGITRIGSRYLIVVGDWDTKHLDFYLGKKNSHMQGEDAFEKVYSMDMGDTDRSDWSDEAWHPYQNINLLTDEDGTLYMAGFGRTERDENVADLFLLKHKNLREYALKKLASKIFACRRGADFQSGAGIFQGPDGKLRIISCGSHIKKSVILNVFN